MPGEKQGDYPKEISVDSSEQATQREMATAIEEQGEILDAIAALRDQSGRPVAELQAELERLMDRMDQSVVRTKESLRRWLYTIQK